MRVLADRSCLQRAANGGAFSFPVLHPLPGIYQDLQLAHPVDFLSDANKIVLKLLSESFFFFKLSFLGRIRGFPGNTASRAVQVIETSGKHLGKEQRTLQLKIMAS